MNFKIIILRKLFRHRYIGGKHTAIENLSKGIPRDKVHEAKEATEELIKENFIISKPTSYGVQISLNPEKIEEVIRLLEENGS